MGCRVSFPSLPPRTFQKPYAGLLRFGVPVRAMTSVDPDLAENLAHHDEYFTARELVRFPGEDGG